MENTPQRIMRQAIESALNSEEETHPQEEVKEPEIQIEPETKRRGRKKIPEQWTRVISLRNDDPDKLQTYLLRQDLDVASGMARPPHSRFHGRDYEPLFWPD